MTGSADRLRRAALRIRRPVTTLRGRHLLVLDVVATAIAIYTAIALRFDARPGLGLLTSLLPGIALPLIARPLVNWRLGLYRRLWRYASTPDMVLVVEASLIGMLVSVAVFYLILLPLDVPGTEGFPRSFWVSETLVALSLQGGMRFLARVVTDHRPAQGAATATRVTPALLFGAGRIGVTIARSALRDPGTGIRPVGFLDDNPEMRGQSIAGLRVLGGLEDLRHAVEVTGARTVLITMASAPGERIREIVEAATAARLEVRTVPPIHELLDGSIDAYRVRNVRVEDLLSRPVATDHAPGVAQLIGGACVMVTGAGGSIGSELARQLHALNPARIILVDRAESPLYTIQRELEIRGLGGRGHGEVVAHLGNVASRNAMAALVREMRPDVIFHAAAYKHVPMMECHPSEGVHVNIGGTMAMLDAAREAGVPRFVLVSTDKAVEPSSVMGATKRVAEALVADAAARAGRPYVSVRFGNVLGSAGSVLPIFMDQLEHGHPLTVTHPDMTRFFMTIPEAAWLILDAASIGVAGDLFVLDMGKPVRIIDLVHDLVRLSGRPADSVPIRITGLRPGEKLHEQLFYDHELAAPTSIPKILRATGDDPWPTIVDDARAILATATGTDDDALRERLFALVATLSRVADVEDREAAHDQEAAAADDDRRPTPADPYRREPALDKDGASRVPVAS